MNGGEWGSMRVNKGAQGRTGVNSGEHVMQDKNKGERG